MNYYKQLIKKFGNLKHENRISWRTQFKVLLNVKSGDVLEYENNEMVIPYTQGVLTKFIISLYTEDRFKYNGFKMSQLPVFYEFEVKESENLPYESLTIYGLCYEHDTLKQRLKDSLLDFLDQNYYFEMQNQLVFSIQTLPQNSYDLLKSSVEEIPFDNLKLTIDTNQLYVRFLNESEVNHNYANYESQ